MCDVVIPTTDIYQVYQVIDGILKAESRLTTARLEKYIKVKGKVTFLEFLSVILELLMMC